MKARPFLLAVALAAFVLLGSALGIGWAMTRQSPLRLVDRPLTLPRAARFVPRDAALSLHWLVDPARLPAYAEAVEAAVPPGTIEWRGFLPTADLQQELGACRALINTPKWNEAYGNVVVEALACGVPVVAYDRGGPGELVVSGKTGFLVPPDAIKAMTKALRQIPEIDRHACRTWVETHATQAVFAHRVETWIQAGLDH